MKLSSWKPCFCTHSLFYQSYSPFCVLSAAHLLQFSFWSAAITRSFPQQFSLNPLSCFRCLLIHDHSATADLLPFLCTWMRYLFCTKFPFCFYAVFTICYFIHIFCLFYSIFSAFTHIFASIKWLTMLITNVDHIAFYYVHQNAIFHFPYTLVEFM